jgi:hypothetical protein
VDFRFWCGIISSVELWHGMTMAGCTRWAPGEVGLGGRLRFYQWSDGFLHGFADFTALFSCVQVGLARWTLVSRPRHGVYVLFAERTRR